MTSVLNHWLIAIAVLAGSFVVGLALDAACVALLRQGLGRGHRARLAIAKALRGQPEVWAVLIGEAVLQPFAFLSQNPQTWIGRTVVILATISVTLFLARLAGSLIRAYLSLDNVSAPSGSIFVNLARMVIWAIGLTFVLGALGVQIGPLVASLGVVGLAVSLGLQDTLANFFSGLQITLSRQIQPGEYIRLNTGEEGTVTDVTWRNTTIRSPGDDLLMVPNSVIARALITNFTAENEEHTTAIPFTVAYGSDLDRVRVIAVQVARDVRDSAPGAIRSFEPTCRFRAMGADGSISAVVTIRVERYQERLPVVSEVVERLHKALGEAEIKPGAAAAVASKPA
ncbi:MAG: mechanosensitive ion channel family protein [Coriobacteriia bacterium]|nr:mechanosensitive ion channel family protein [Coriobacteriia bacterium]